LRAEHGSRRWRKPALNAHRNLPANDLSQIVLAKR
jgi:hypothetical protein